MTIHILIFEVGCIVTVVQYVCIDLAWKITNRNDFDIDKMTNAAATPPFAFCRMQSWRHFQDRASSLTLRFSPFAANPWFVHAS